MANFALKIVKRRKQHETDGWVSETIGLESTDPDRARKEASQHLSDLNWNTHFAWLESDDGKFIAFWTSNHA